jgi:hypothetical protein
VIAVSVVVLGLSAGLSVLNVGVILVTAALLFFTKVPAPLIVLALLLTGVLLPPL